MRHYLLADLNDLNAMRPTTASGAGGLLSDTVIILLAVLGVVVLVLLWAIFVRKREDRRYNTLKVPNTRNRDSDEEDGKHRRKRRHRRRDHRGRNPTLSETGGLPPMRPEQSPPPKT